MAFDAGTIMAHLDVDEKAADDKIRKFEDRIKRMEKEPHHVRVDAQFESGSMTRARKMFADLDQQISRDAANRLRNSPQGSVLGALNALFSPHPVTGSPTPIQASQQGLLGRMVNPPGTEAPQGTNRNVVADAAAAAAASQVAGGGGGGGRGAGGLFNFLRSRFGGGGGGGFASGLLGGIGPGILGLSAKATSIAGLGGSLLGALPALTAPLAGLGVAGLGAGAVALLAKGSLSSVTPLLQAQQQAQQALAQATTPQARQAAQQQLAGVQQALGQLPAAQQSMFKSINSIQSAWQNMSASFGPVLAKGLSQAASLFRSLMPDIKSFFSAATTLIGPFIKGIGDIAKDILPGLGQAFRAVAPVTRPLLDALGGLVKGFLPGLVALLKASAPAVTAFAQILAMIGRDLGSMLKDFAPVLSASSVLLKGLFAILGGLLPVIGKLAAYFATLLAPVFLQFGAAIKALMPFLVTVGKVLGALAGAVLADLAGALTAVARLLIGIAPSLNVVAKALDQLFTVLENTGVFASLGDVLENITPQLAKLVNTLVGQLAPYLPILISLLSEFGVIMIRLVGAGLTTVLQGVSFVLQKLPFLVPVLAAVGAAWLAWNLIIAANPIGLIVIAIAGLIGAITLLVTHWKQVWGDIKNWAEDAWRFIWDGFGKYLLPLLGPVGLIALGAIELYQHWKTIWGDIKQVGEDFWQWIWTDFGQKIASFLTRTLPGWFETAVDFIGTAWNNIENAIKTPVVWVVNNVLDGLISAFDWITSHLGLGKPITPFHIAGLAAGGRIPGFGGGDRHLVALEGGETVIDKDRSRQLAWLWKMLGIPGYQGGGVVPGRGAALGATNPSGGDPLGGFLHGAYDVARITAAIATGNTVALSNAIKALMGHSGAGGATAEMAKMLLAIPTTLIHDAVQWLFGNASGGGGVGRPSGHGAIGGGVQQWTGLVMRVLRMLGQPAGDLGTVLAQMTTESGGNPRAINLWDINAQMGDPSRGLMQVIMSTFLAYAGPFLSRGIWDPLANIYAGINYAIHRYGAGWTSVLGHGHGYDQGGWLNPGWLNGTGRPEAVLTPRQSDSLLALATAAAAGSGTDGSAILAALDRLTEAVRGLPDAIGATVGGALNGTARISRQRGGLY